MTRPLLEEDGATHLLSGGRKPEPGVTDSSSHKRAELRIPESNPPPHVGEGRRSLCESWALDAWARSLGLQGPSVMATDTSMVMY